MTVGCPTATRKVDVPTMAKHEDLSPSLQMEPKTKQLLVVFCFTPS